MTPHWAYGSMAAADAAPAPPVQWPEGNMGRFEAQYGPF